MGSAVIKITTAAKYEKSLNVGSPDQYWKLPKKVNSLA